MKGYDWEIKNKNKSKYGNIAISWKPRVRKRVRRILSSVIDKPSFFT